MVVHARNMEIRGLKSLSLLHAKVPLGRAYDPGIRARSYTQHGLGFDLCAVLSCVLCENLTVCV